jgi:hypothetical protein
LTADFDRLGRAYRRLAADTGRRIDFACDIDSDDALRIAEEERSFLDQAFFVLLFGALERQMNLLAVARQNDEDRRTAMRNAPFERRLEAATRVATESIGAARTADIVSAHERILGWYEIRNQIAHGEPPTSLLDVVALLRQAAAISALLSEVQVALGSGRAI